ncbi:bifunctional sugar phosphate isomerase/epimerase/4-hydroxyphenylpyruvate dioxygenase family protein [Zobellella iuensis]|uniref:3-dehydroshikimate dehydratase n=1 Tax=Zobellella iuensis TaxID=2803811 RepID=A0ABS1QLZ8_9GAMM|nr:sugar phosphate isomerase/epimerase and 4-hydroxyphenylpyruvate domain-containing protein [Zobellella iuensis]MBL1375875.1 sugar phosphate isomerase/epimerase and 4-hydroxyphenylpyruvate domain-containing protein [Zobellella iuensis]
MKTALATVTLSGTLREKLEAAAAAGFQGVEIFENDLTQSDLTPGQVRQLAADLGLEIIALQPLRDFEAMPEPFRQQNFYRAQRKFELMHELGTRRLLICSNVSPHVIDDPARAAADLHELAELARHEGFHIGYEALAWGRHVRDYDQAWDIVKRADHSQLGIILDSFHMFARGNSLDLLRDEIPLDKIALVQVADAPSLQMEILHFSRHFRCFPGQGDMPLVEFVQCLKDKGFDDYLSHEIFNDEFRSSSPAEKAVDGMRSLIWLDDQTSATGEDSRCPEIQDIEFVEFAIEGDTGEELLGLFRSLGFRETHKHKSKQVTLMRQGDINLVLNREPESLAHQHYLAHGTSVCALALATDNLKQLLRRTRHYRCNRFEHQAGPGELNIPAIRGVGDSLVYFVERRGPYRFFDIDFEPMASDEPAPDYGLSRIDHIGQTVAPVDFLSASFFYKSIFGFDIEPSQDLPDVYGLMVSRVARNQNGKIRIPINMSSAREASAQRFISRSKGSGVQQIAFESRDIFATAEQVGAERILSIPDNYYRDLDARFALEPELLARLKRLNILYDRNDEGEFFHFYTHEVQGVFFEVVQRRGYSRYGEINAHIRLASQAREYKAAGAS